MRILGRNNIDNFIDPDQPYPTLVTTSEMLSTGVDCKTCGLIVIDKEIGSMTEFKQIVGRGTRLRTDKGKWHFEILDFRNVTQLFKDQNLMVIQSWKVEGVKHILHIVRSRTVSHDQPPREYGRKKYYINGKDIQINTEIVSYLGADGHTLVTESLTDFTRKNIRGKYATLDEFIKNWTAADKKKVIVDELKEYNVLLDAVREKRPDLLNADIFDIICHVAFDKQPLTRKERANNVKKRDYLSRYEGVAKQVLEALLDKYADKGILEFENEDNT